MTDEYLGCGDGSCIIETPKGQHTNGGCRCFRHLQPIEYRLRLQRAFQRMKKRIKELEKQD